MALAYARLPERVKERIEGLRARHSIEASFGARLPIEQRLELKERSRMRSTRWSASIRRRGRRSVRQQLHDASDELPHRRERPERNRLRAGRRRSAAVPADSGHDPEYQVRWRWTKNSIAIWDKPLDAALRGPGLLAGSSKDGARRDRRRPPLLSLPSALQLFRNGVTQCISTTMRSSPRTRTSWSSPSRRTVRNGRWRTSPRTCRSRWTSTSSRRWIATRPARPCCTSTSVRRTGRARSGSPSSTSSSGVCGRLCRT
ncbi:hypothetical protein GS436_02105 [Rhodococcus hoagii]|nr:hypothetical protein [Prescottella equi]